METRSRDIGGKSTADMIKLHKKNMKSVWEGPNGIINRLGTETKHSAAKHYSNHRQDNNGKALYLFGLHTSGCFFP
jgi:hypothetical protein